MVTGHMEYYRAAMPAAYNDRAEVRQLEPYVQGQTTYSTYSPAPATAVQLGSQVLPLGFTTVPYSLFWASGPLLMAW